MNQEQPATLTNEMYAYIKELKQSALGNYLDDEQLKWMLTHCEIVTYENGHYIYTQGKSVKGIFIILKGTVDLIAKVVGQGVTKIETMEAGDILGGICFIEKGPCATSAIAKTEVTCLFLGEVCLELLGISRLKTKYKLLQAISIHVCRRIKRTHDKATEYMSTADMAGLSLIGRVIHTLTQPTELQLSDDFIQKEKLRDNSLLNIFSDTEKQEILHRATLLEAPKNCILIHEGEKNSSCYIILHGAVQSSIMQDNKLAKLSVIGPNSLFASVTCVETASKFTITFITCEAAVLLKLSEDDLLYFQNEKPELWYKLFHLICNSLVALGKSINKLDIRLHIEDYNR